MAITMGDVMKPCTICKIEKPYSEFHKQSSRKDGYCSWCKPCKSAKKAAEYQATKEHVKSRVATYRKNNPSKVKACKAESHAKKPDKYKKMWADYYYANREAALLYAKSYKEKNKDAVLARGKKYYRDNSEILRAKQSEYQKRNIDARREYSREYWKRRAKKDPMCALKSLVRRRVLFAFSNHGYRKESKTQEMLGCDYATLKHHLESQFTPGMTWANRGEWHIDHIIPLASASNESELIGLCHYTNLQPLWAKDNLSKGAKMPDEMNLERRQCSPLYSPSPVQSQQSPH
jgi:hypothetical protein